MQVEQQAGLVWRPGPAAAPPSPVVELVLVVKAGGGHEQRQVDGGCWRQRRAQSKAPNRNHARGRAEHKGALQGMRGGVEWGRLPREGGVLAERLLAHLPCYVTP